MRKILFTAILILSIIQLTGCYDYPKEYHPADGTWYCAELQVQLNFSPSNFDSAEFYEDKLYMQVDDDMYYDSYIMLDGHKFRCSPRCPWNSSHLYIQYDDPRFNETQYKAYDIGYYFYETEIISLSDDKMVLKDLNTNGKYIFMRIE